MSTITIAQAEERTGVSVLEHLDREVSVPVVDRLAAQGDVLIRRVTDAAPAATKVPREGVAVVRGENGGNTHLLLGDGVTYDQRDVSASSLVLGVVTVPAGAQALLAHPEHGFLAIAPGTYEARRQREMREELALVAD